MITPPRSTFPISMIVLGCLLTLTAAVGAQESTTQPGENANMPPTSTRPAPPTTPNRPESPLAAQRRAVIEAQAELTKATQAYNAAKAKVADAIKQTPQWQQLTEAHSQAQKAFAAATQPVLDKLRATPQYQAAAQGKARADEKMADLRSSANPTADAFTEAGREQATNAALMRKLDDDALAADAKAAQAKTNLDASNTALNDLKKQADETAANDPSVQSGKQAVEEAQKKLEEARKALADAVKANRPQRQAPPPPQRSSRRY